MRGYIKNGKVIHENDIQRNKTVEITGSVFVLCGNTVLLLLLCTEVQPRQKALSYASQRNVDIMINFDLRLNGRTNHTTLSGTTDALFGLRFHSVLI